MENFTNSQQQRNHYTLLGVTQASDRQEIRRAYRQKQLQYHPDKGGDEETCKHLNQAFATLMDKAARDKYDEEIMEEHCGGGADIFQSFLPDGNSPKNSDEMKEKLKNWQAEYETIELSDNFTSDLVKLLEKLLVILQPTEENQMKEQKKLFCEICDTTFTNHFDHFDRVMLIYLRRLEGEPALFEKLRQCSIKKATPDEKFFFENEAQNAAQPIKVQAEFLKNEKWLSLPILEKNFCLILAAISSQTDTTNLNKNCHLVQKYKKLTPGELEFVSRYSATFFKIRTLLYSWKAPVDHVLKGVAALGPPSKDLEIIKNILRAWRRVPPDVEGRKEFLGHVTTELVVKGHLDVLFLIFFTGKLNFSELAHILRHLGDQIEAEIKKMKEPAKNNSPILIKFYDGIAAIFCYMKKYASFIQGQDEGGQQMAESFRFQVKSIPVDYSKLFQMAAIPDQIPIKLDKQMAILESHVAKFLATPAAHNFDDLILGDLALIKISLMDTTTPSWDELIQNSLAQKENGGEVDGDYSKKFLAILFTQAKNYFMTENEVSPTTSRNAEWQALKFQFEEMSDPKMAALCCFLVEAGEFELAENLVKQGQHYLAVGLYLKFETCDLDYFAAKYQNTKSASYLMAAIQRLEEMGGNSKRKEQILCLTKFAQDFFSSSFHPPPPENNGAAATPTDNDMEQILHSIIQNFRQSSSQPIMLPAHFLMLKHSAAKFRLMGALHMITSHGNIRMGENGETNISKYAAKLVNERFNCAADQAMCARNLKGFGDLLVGLNKENYGTLKTFFESKRGHVMLKDEKNFTQNWRQRATVQPPTYEQLLYKSMLFLVRGTLKKIEGDFSAAALDYYRSMTGLVGDDSEAAARSIAMLMQDGAFHDEAYSKLLTEEIKLLQSKLRANPYLVKPDDFRLLFQHVEPWAMQRDFLQKISSASSGNSPFKWEKYIWKSSNSLANAFAYLDYEPNTNSLLLASSYFLEAMTTMSRGGFSCTLPESFSYLRAIENSISTVVAILVLGRKSVSVLMRLHYVRISLSLLLQAGQKFEARWRVDKNSKSNKLDYFTQDPGRSTQKMEPQQILSKSSQMWLELLIKEFHQGVQLVPFTGTKIGSQIDTHVLGSFGSEFLQPFLDLKVNSTCRDKSRLPLLANFQYAQFEEIMSGRIPGDFRQAKMRTIDAILESHDFQLGPVLENFYWPFGSHLDSGWKDMENRSLRFPTNETSLLFSRIDGFQVDKNSGEIKLMMKKDRKNPLFSMEDVREIFHLAIGAAAFTLEDPSPDTFAFHPFQEARYLPKRLEKTRYLATLMRADLLLKELTAGVEINFFPPFCTRLTTEGLLSKLPADLQKALRPIHQRDEEKDDDEEKIKLDSCAHRFWIAMVDILIDMDDSKDSVFNFRVSDPRVEVRKHLLKRNMDGELIDAQEDSNENSSEAKFAREFTKNYDQIGTFFPELLRLKELQKISIVCGQLRGMLESMEKRLSGPELPEKIFQSVTDVLTQGYHNWVNILSTSENFRDLEQKVRTELGYFPDEGRTQIWNVLEKRERDNLPKLAENLKKCFHVNSHNLVQFKALFRSFLAQRSDMNYNNFFSICYNGLLTHTQNEIQVQINHIKKWGVNTTNFDADDEGGLAGSVKGQRCTWVPAAFCSKDDESQGQAKRLQIYGGVAMTATAREGTVPQARDGKIWQYDLCKGQPAAGSIYGAGQITGTKRAPNFRHAALANNIAVGLQSQGHTVYLDTAYRTVTGNRTDSLRRPDIIYVDGQTGKVSYVEIASKWDRVNNLIRRNEVALSQLNQNQMGRGYVVRYDEYIKTDDLPHWWDIVK